MRHAPTAAPRLLLAATLALSACKKPPAEADAADLLKADPQGVSIQAGAPQWKYVELSKAELSEPLAPLPVPAHVSLDPRRSAAVGAPLSGRVESVAVRLGSRVKKGDKLFSVRSGAYADLDHDLQVAQAQVTVRQRLLDRSKELYELKAIPQKDVLAAEAEVAEARLHAHVAESRKQSLAVTAEGSNLFWVRALRAGAVVELSVAPGQEVGPEHEEPLLRLSDLDEVLVVADVPEAVSGDVRAGDKAEVLLAGSERQAGTVDYVSEVVDPQRRTVETWVRARNTERHLRPNAFVEVVFQSSSDGQLVKVPDAAVVTLGTQSVVFVQAAPGRLEPRAVKTRRRRDGLTEVRDGLRPGETFVARGALLLLNQVDLASGT